MPIDSLHNLTWVPPIQYVLYKLIHSYSNRLQGLPLNAKTWTILSKDQCHYWPDYLTPITNLWCAFLHPSIFSHWVEGQDLLEAWNTPRFYYLHSPSQIIITTHKAEFHTLHLSHIHIIISTHTDAHTPYAIYQSLHKSGTVQELDQIQALCLAVLQALYTDHLHTYLPIL